MFVTGLNLYLRSVLEADLDQLYQYDCDIEARGSYFPIFISSETAFKDGFRKTGYLTEDDGMLLICDLDDQLLGILYFFKATPYYAGLEIGYRLFDTSNSGRGIITEALMLCSYFLFSWQQIHRLELKIMPENTASKRVAEKCGYQFEGVARKCILHQGTYRDMAIYSLLREEAPKSRDELIERLNAGRSLNRQD